MITGGNTYISTAYQYADMDVLENGLTARWDFSEAAGANVADVASGLYPATFNNLDAADRVLIPFGGGKWGIDFDGVNEQCTFYSDNVHLGLPHNWAGGLSVAALFRADSTALYRGIISKNSQSSTPYGGICIFFSTGGVLRFGLGHSGVSPWEGISTASAISTATWYHVVFTWDRSVLRVYLNGFQNNTFNTAGAPSNLDYPGDSPNNLPAYIGRSEVAGGTSKYWDGILSDVRVYNRALIPAEVFLLWQRQNMPASVSHDNSIAQAISQAIQARTWGAFF